MRTIALAAMVLGAAAPVFAQLTADQRETDFRQLANLYAQRYAPYEWKRDALRYDALDLKPWLERVRGAKDDLEFYDLCVQYVAALNDGHDAYLLPSTFTASLGFTADLFDGKALIDGISRDVLPAEQYPFQTGDELAMMDGQTSDELIARFEKYSVTANPVSTRREAASRITQRDQSFMPRAHEIGESATVVIRRASGDLETYTIPWQKSGIPVTTLAPGRSPRSAGRASAPPESDSPSYLRPLRRLRNLKLPRTPLATGVGRLKPVFTLPDGFVQRLGSSSYDDYFSGIFEAEGYKIGFLRIPDFAYRSARTFEKEVAFLQGATDGLILDVMRNPGGEVCLAEDLVARVMPGKFQLVTMEARVTWTDLLEVSSALEDARQYEWATPEELAQLDLLKNEFEAAYRQNGGRTRPMPICGTLTEREPAVDSDGNVIGYTKPLMVLTDEFSASSAEVFAATIQDNQRGPLFGMRTVGAGGSPVDFPAGLYSEGTAYVTVSLVSRVNNIATPDYPAAPYIENIGVQPDIVFDYMTKESLLSGGRPFVAEFTRKMVEHIRSSQQP